MYLIAPFDPTAMNRDVQPITNRRQCPVLFPTFSRSVRAADQLAHSRHIPEGAWGVWIATPQPDGTYESVYSIEVEKG